MQKKFFIIAGENFGDILGAKLMREIKIEAENQGFEPIFSGIGGNLMEIEGLKSIFHMSHLSIMGFFEVLPKIPKILKKIKLTISKIKEFKPDYLITIDSPDFSFRVVKKIADKKCKKIHLIAPSVWAYREKRAKKISKIYDLLLTILPFEPPYFEKYGLKTRFIGHLITENAPNLDKKERKSLEFRQNHDLKESDLLILTTPGSRISEVTKIFPDFIKSLNLLALKYKNLTPIILAVPKTKNLVEKMAKKLNMNYKIIDTSDEKLKKSAFFACNFAMAKSGTNNLEILLYKIPLVICYKVNFLTYLALKIMLKTKFVNLINIILQKEVIPELLQYDCNFETIAKNLDALMEDENICHNQIDESQKALKIMGLEFEEKPSKMAALEILSL